MLVRRVCRCCHSAMVCMFVRCRKVYTSILQIRKTSTQMFLKFAELFEVCKAAELQLQALRCGQLIDHTAEWRPVYYLLQCSEANVAFYSRGVLTCIKKQRCNGIHMCTASE
jgi:hypothetical protein